VCLLLNIHLCFPLSIKIQVHAPAAASVVALTCGLCELLVGLDGGEVRLCGPYAFVRPRVPCVSRLPRCLFTGCVSRLPPVSFYRPVFLPGLVQTLSSEMTKKHCGLQCLLLVLHGASGYPDRMDCSQALTVGTTIMFAISESDSQHTASFVGKACGGTFTAGETLTATTNAPGQYLMELTGGATFTGGKCNGVRIDNANSATVSTTGAGDGATITLKHGRASSSSSPVYISTPCTLTRLAASCSTEGSSYTWSEATSATTRTITTK
jgi:hypothetical protein